jgi:hypothetical protein
VRSRALVFLLALAAALVTVPSADAKFSISLAVKPTSPIAKRPVRVTMRTGIALPEKHGMRLVAVGPRRDGYDVTFFDVRLVRTGPRAFRATVHFPRAGWWRLIVPNWGAPGSAYPPPVDRPVRVRPST